MKPIRKIFSHPNFMLNRNYTDKICVATAMACHCDEILNINCKYTIVLLEISRIHYSNFNKKIKAELFTACVVPKSVDINFQGRNKIHEHFNPQKYLI